MGSIFSRQASTEPPTTAIDAVTAQPSPRPIVAQQSYAFMHANQATLQDNAILQQNNLPNATFPGSINNFIQPHIEITYRNGNNPQSLPTEVQEKWLSDKVQELQRLSNKEIENDETIAQGLALYVPLEGSALAKADSGKDLEEQVTMDFLSSDNKAKVLLLQGNSGSGKSLFAQYIKQTLWNNYKPGCYIPLFVSLPQFQTKYPQEIHGLLLETVLQKRGFSSEEVDDFKLSKKAPLLLILDGYDETGLTSNLYKENQLKDWNVKVIITCRSQYLTPGYQDQFKHIGADHTSINSSLIELHIVPFAEAKLKDYIHKFANNSKYYKEDWSEDRYNTELTRIQKWQELARDPFTLSTLLTILPELTPPMSVSSGIERTGIPRILTRAVIYDEFTNQWFNKEFLRLGPDWQAYIRGINLERAEVFTIFEEFAMDRACEMFISGKQTVIRPMKEWRSSQAEHKKSKWEKLFESKDQTVQQELRMGLAGSPLKYLGDKEYEFIHHSFQEYFFAKSLIRDLQNRDANEPYKHLNVKLLTTEPGIIAFIVDRLQSNDPKDQRLKDILFNIIDQSKTNHRLKQTGSAAANAITILNYANIPLASRDFQGVHIAGADLSNANLDYTDFRNANLQNVSFVQAWMRGTFLNGSNMEGVRFGEYPYIQNSSDAKCLAVTFDGKHLIIGNKICEKESGREVANLAIPSMRCVAVTIDDKHIIGTGYKQVSEVEVIYVWNRNGALVKQLHGHAGTVTCIAAISGGKCVSGSGSYSYNGKTVIDNTVRVWDDTISEVVGVHAKGVTCVAATKDGKYVISGSKDCTIRMWDLATHESTILLEHTSDIHCLSITSDSRTLVSGSDGGLIHVFDLANKTCLRSFKAEDYRVTKIVLTNDNKRIVSSGLNKDACIWDLESGNLIRKLQRHDAIHDIAIDPNDNVIITLESGCLRMFDMEAIGGEKPTMNNHDKAVSCLTLTPYRRQIISGSSDGTIHIREIHSGALTRSIEQDTGSIYSVAVSPDGRFLLAGGEPSYSWDLHSGKFMASFSAPCKTAECIIITPDGKAIIGGPLDPISVHSIPNGEKLFELGEFFGGTESMVLSQDGTKLYTATNNVFCIWDLASRKLEDKLKIDDYDDSKIGSILLSQDGKNLIAARYDGKLLIWKLEDKTYHVFKAEETDPFGSIPCLAMTDDGKQVITGGRNGKIRIWSSQDWTEMSSISTPSCVMRMQCIKTNDGHLLITGSMDGCIRCWKFSKDFHAATLLWSSGQNNLFISQVSTTGIVGLSPANMLLLKQHNSANTEMMSDFCKVNLDGNMEIRAKVDEVRQAPIEPSPTPDSTVNNYSPLEGSRTYQMI